MKINKSGLDKELSRQFSPALKKIAKRRLMREIDKVHSELMRNFENHPITKEISKGPSALNTSGTLGGYGNLFSYIGFDSGDNPILAIRVILEKSLLVRHIPSGSKSLIENFVVSLPSMSEIEEATPMPWASGRSWVKGIEHGIAGFGRYLKMESEYSRSGAAIQSKKSIRGGAFRNTSYLSSILNQLEKSINSALSI